MSKLAWAAVVLLAASCFGQKQLSDAEQKDLREGVAEAGSSPVELIRALERHLGKYPDSPQKDEFERVIAKSAIEAKDNERTLLYGERVIARNGDNMEILERVIRLLLNSEEKAPNERALKYARKFEEVLRTLEKQGVSSSRNSAAMLDELDRALGRALVFQARATGNLGNLEEALKFARASYERFPNAESAREVARWLARSGKEMEAVQYYAEAFTIADSRNTEADRGRDRVHMGQLYSKLKGSETGLGDIILQAYDRTAAVVAQRQLKQRQRDPNADQSDPMQFTLTGIKGEKLKLSSLKGKVVVMDFWATWCGPCRTQQPLYEEVKTRFTGNDNVVFLNINTDEDQTVVEPFLNEMKWNKNVYFDDGLQNLLRVSSIPTTIIINTKGQVSSRMNGFLPDRFVGMLTDRINEALTVN